jgi:hypothetical protein
MAIIIIKREKVRNNKSTSDIIIIIRSLERERHGRQKSVMG